MARYIDADALIKKIFPMGIGDGMYTINAKAVKFAIDNIPTADVVPKSEVARKIFEEIDSKILAEIDINNGVLVEFEGADEPYHRIKGEVSALCKIQDFIAELKKKYTEDTE